MFASGTHLNGSIQVNENEPRLSIYYIHTCLFRATAHCTMLVKKHEGCSRTRTWYVIKTTMVKLYFEKCDSISFI